MVQFERDVFEYATAYDLDVPLLKNADFQMNFEDENDPNNNLIMSLDQLASQY